MLGATVALVSAVLPEPADWDVKMVLPLDTDAILDLAVLGVVLQEPQPLPVLCAHVQALVAPWLTPTLEVIEGRISRLCVQHQLAMGACSTPDRSEERRVGKECRSRW